MDQNVNLIKRIELISGLARVGGRAVGLRRHVLAWNRTGSKVIKTDLYEDFDGRDGSWS